MTLNKFSHSSIISYRNAATDKLFNYKTFQTPHETVYESFGQEGALVVCGMIQGVFMNNCVLNETYLFARSSVGNEAITNQIW